TDDDEEWLEDEIRAIVSEGQAGGLVEADERGMIEGVIELDEKDVCSVMTPRSKLDVLEVNTDWDTAVRFVVETGRTRVPVYEERLDQIVGVLFAKDLLRESLLPQPQRKPLREFLRQPLIVPESKMLDEMLKQFLGAHTHMAIVVDEYGGVAGLVTIEDILEEIVGEIVDESDSVEPDDFLMVEPGRAVVVGTARIDRINQRLGVNLPEDAEFDTIAGLLMQHFKTVPRPGSRFSSNGTTLHVLRASRRWVEQVEILVTHDSDQTPDLPHVA
ncbi:MAG TPA: hemolysin family protein, partial [Pirellulaceae bacterium]|nr:hemolysin family protein [Pirellulaceae bacterium]